MTVAILMPIATQRGGAEQLLLALMRRCADYSPIRWLIIFFEDGPMRAELQSMGIETLVLPTGRLRDVPRYASTVYNLCRIIRRRNINVVFSWMSKAHLYGGVASALTGTPALWYQHKIPDRGSGTDRLVTLIRAEGVFTCSQTVAKAQQRMWPYRSTRVVHPTMEQDRFDPHVLPSPQEARAQLNLPLTGPIIGIVGRLQRWKGMHVLLGAMPRILRTYPDSHCLIVGGQHDLEPDYWESLQNQAETLGIQDHVRFSGFQRNIPTWMQAMDVVVHASDHEPFGIVIIEAMALGKPVVAGDAGGPQEIITEGVNGLLAPYGDNEALAQQILTYLNDPAFAEKVGRAARERALDFTPDTYARRFTEHLYDLLDIDSSKKPPMPVTLS